MLSRRRLRRAWWMEFEFYSASAAIGWAAIAYGTDSSMADRPSMSALSYRSDDAWALIVGSLGAIQLAAVLGNSKWARWLVAVPMTYFWGTTAMTILTATCIGKEPMPLAFALYAAAALASAGVVGRMPRDFPPIG